MAYADSIRTSAATAEAIATLIEGIFAAGYPATYTAWVPTISAVAPMTISASTIFYARYLLVGKKCSVEIGVDCTTATTASSEITFTLPFTAASLTNGQWVHATTQNGAVAGGHISIASGSTTGSARLVALGNWGLGATRQFYSNFDYETA